MAFLVIPCAARALILSACLATVGTLPRYFPSALALAIPSLCRSSIIARSNSATLPRTLSISFPVAVLVSSPRSRTLSPTFRLSKSADDLPKVGDRTGQPVQLGDHQSVTPPDKPQGTLQGWPLADRRNLLPKEPLAPCLGQGLQLGFKSCDLIQGACPGIPHEHV